MKFLCFLAIMTLAVTRSSPPDPFDKVLTARWMADEIGYGVLSTMSKRLPGYPFGNVYSFAAIDGVPYFYGTYMDQSFRDMKQNSYASFTLSEASLELPACDTSNYGDQESPTCARLVLTGQLHEVLDDEDVEKARNALFAKHPQMKSWPKNHDWVVAKLDILDIWLIDYFGGPSILNVTDYLNAEISNV